MLAGTLAKAGYFMGDDLYPPRDSNPKGFFEDPVINGINEQILEPLDYRTTHPVRTAVCAAATSLPRSLASRINAAIGTDYPLTYGQRWLERVPLGQRIESTNQVVEQIKEVTKRAPFCFKDPRFSYTLPVWRPYLENTVFICIFREPGATANSIVKECKDMEYLESVKMSFDIAIEVWTQMYKHILSLHRHTGEWMFLHYNQMMDPKVLDMLEQFTGAHVDRSFPDIALRRSRSNGEISPKVQKIYAFLCQLAGYHET
ncbi:hypothetical protein KP004_14790 [Geomonas oryzisoli]|uniref:Sulfotransferase domain-containing protein n=1 Tax=Geomonas oryzisoli TaxID=2847992 RepID=A0ABX8JA91_9BACT|nr:hypothetical protein [Geomonas oryzisoli]QWV92460.1 hypothetical protein KP004_14790 [Geomonas oryzisoli]